jgi:hypothetical protein
VIFLGEANGMHSDRCRAEAVTERRRSRVGGLAA